MAWIDLARSLSIVAVIAIHVTSTLVLRSDHPASFWAGNLVDSASRWSVPLFVMVSGHLLLRPGGTSDLREFYRRRLARIGVPLVVWTVAYLLFGAAVYHVPATIGDALRRVALGIPYYHLYFLYLIMGLYAVAPLLRAFLAAVGPAERRAVVVVALLLGMTDVALGGLWGIGAPNAVTRFLPYVGYFMAGSVLAEIRPSRGRVLTAWSLLVVGIAVTAVGTAVLVAPNVLGQGHGKYLYEYLSITTVPVTVSMFLLLKWGELRIQLWAEAGWWRAVSALAGASFGVYLVHPIFLAVLETHGLSARTTNPILSIPALIVAVSAASFILVRALEAIPWLRRVV